jgi:hypothetical protein
MPRGVAKSDLPQKICAHCGRPFTWRRKWARDWEHVKYCSNACRQGNIKGHGPLPLDTSSHAPQAKAADATARPRHRDEDTKRQKEK